MGLESLARNTAFLVALPCTSTVLAACSADVEPVAGSQVAVSSASAALGSPPAIQLDSPNDIQRQRHHLQFGNPNDAYWMEDNDWNARHLTEGPAPDQYEQNVGVHPPVGPGGEVAFRMKWRWPSVPWEVKGYPAVLSGRKPGFYSPDSWVNGQPIRLLDGSFSQTAPSGHTPGTFMPLQLPLPPVTAKFAHSHLAPPTGQGQLTFDIWLQSHPGQDEGFVNSSITHEIMIPLDNWGNYGVHPTGRNSDWYDHDAVINGRLYHVYCTKGQDGELHYNFGYLNRRYGRNGWKMIAFVPAVTPVPPGEIDLAAFINYIATRTDSAGTPWGQGNEYLVSVELGVEPVVGTGDIVVHDYRVARAVTSPRKIQAEDGVLSGTGVRVMNEHSGYEGTGYVGPFSDANDQVTLSFPNVTAGTYDVHIRYKSGGQQMNEVNINNGSIRWSAMFPGTNYNWMIKTLRGVTLGSGTNTLAIIKDWGWFYVDSVEIVPASPGSGDTSTATRKQVENGNLSGVRIVEYQPGYEGRGAVGPFENAGDQAAVSFTNVAAGRYDIRIRYHSGTLQMNQVDINGVPRSESFPATGSSWAIKTLSSVMLGAGANIVAIVKEWGWFTVDYIEIVPAP